MTNIFRIPNHRKHGFPAGEPSQSASQRPSATGTLSSRQLKQIVADLIG